MDKKRSCVARRQIHRCLKQVSNSLKGTPEYLPKQEPVWDTKYGKKKRRGQNLVTFETREKNLLAMGKTQSNQFSRDIIRTYF